MHFQKKKKIKYQYFNSHYLYWIQTLSSAKYNENAYNKERFIFRDFQDFYGQKQELEASNRSEVPRQNDDPVNPDQSFGHGKDSSSAAALERLASSRADEWKAVIAADHCNSGRFQKVGNRKLR